MQVLNLSLRDFRCYSEAQIDVGDGLTVVTGPNGAGKTNLLEGLYFACTGRSCRTSNEREVIRFGAGTTQTVLRCQNEDGLHELDHLFELRLKRDRTAQKAVADHVRAALGAQAVAVFAPLLGFASNQALILTTGDAQAEAVMRAPGVVSAERHRLTPTILLSGLGRMVRNKSTRRCSSASISTARTAFRC